MTSTTTSIVTYAEEREEAEIVSTGSAFDPNRDPVRLLSDEKDSWRVLRRRNGEGAISWSDARQIVEESILADGVRTDRGLGVDRLVVDYDARGVLHVTEARTEQGRLVPGFAPVPLRLHAFRQLAARIGAPAPYLARKLPAGLARACLTHGIATAPADAAKTGLLRMADGEARALVTGRYAVLDHRAFLDAAELAFGRQGISLADLRVSALATGPRLVLRATLATEATELKRGDVVEVGLDLTNGELGNAAGGVSPLVYRLVCTNGLRRMERSGGRRVIRHIGDPGRALETLESAIPAALDDARGTVSLFREASTRIVERAVEVFNGGLRLFGLTAAEERAARAEVEGEVGQLTEGSAVTVADLVNGITASARTVGTERRLELEGIAGEVLTARRIGPAR